MLVPSLCLQAFGYSWRMLTLNTSAFVLLLALSRKIGLARLGTGVFIYRVIDSRNAYI